MGHRSLFPAIALLLLAGCTSTAAELRGLAKLPSLPYSVLISGGAFLEKGSGAGEQALSRTFGAPDVAAEPIALQELVEVLQLGRVFVHSARDRTPGPGRRKVVDDPAARRSILQRARAAGHDLVVVFEWLRDGPVEEHGVNGRWPVTLSLWFAFGLGLVIPDHTYESTATLRVSVRDVHTGAELYRSTRSSGPVDLSLVERTNLWGLLSSLLLPPFFVPDDQGMVLDSVREVTARRLVLSVARQLKSVEVREALADGAAARIVLVRGDGGGLLEVRCQEGLAAVRLRWNGVPLGIEDQVALEQQLLSSRQLEGEINVYRAALPELGALFELQVLVQTVSGRAASITAVPGELQ